MKKSRRIYLIIAAFLISISPIFLNSATLFAVENSQQSEESQVEAVEVFEAKSEGDPKAALIEQEVSAKTESQIYDRKSDSREEDEPIKIYADNTSAQIYISAIRTANGEKYIELFNATNKDIQLSEISLKYFASGTTVRNITLEDGIFLANSYILLAQDSGFLKDFDQILATDPASTGLIGKSTGALVLEYLDEFGAQKDEVCWGAKNNYSCADDRYAKSGLADHLSLVKCFGAECVANYITLGDYQPKFGGFEKDEIFLEPEPEPTITNECLGIKLSEISANNSEQFIEIYNSNSESASLKNCALQTNRNTKKYVFDEIWLDSGAYFTLNISDSPLLLTKTTSGTVYFLDEGNNETDSIRYDNLKIDTSWSKFGDWNGQNWRQTYLVTPNSENQFAEYPACEIGYERNFETGRCNKITEPEITPECAEGYFRNLTTGRCKKNEVSTVLAECKAGYYRSTETNRCRKVSVETAKAECKDGYYRNPETGRCKKVEVAAKLTPCKAGYERNPETNRCRKIVSNSGASDQIEDEDVKSEFSGWPIIFGGLLILFSMIIWGYRQDILENFKKIRDSRVVKK